MTGRKLASVRLIDSIQPIPKADRIELAKVDGWNAVIPKGKFTVGEKIVYCEIDSLLPIRDEFEHLRKSCYIKQQDGVEGFRLKTMKLRGQISQGLVVPLLVLNVAEWNVGDDVTDVLGVKKYEPIIATKGLMQFPGFIPKTDEERVQNLVKQLKTFQGQRFYVTEKIDGTSLTAYWDGDEFGVCQRNFRQTPGSTTIYTRITRKLALEEKLKELGRKLAIQGELHGHGIQGNLYDQDISHLSVFNMYDIEAGTYLPKREVKALADKLGLETVPVIAESLILPESVEEILALAEGKSKLNPRKEREGLVFVCNDMIDDQRVSFKAISNKFLIKNSGK